MGGQSEAACSYARWMVVGGAGLMCGSGGPDKSSTGGKVTCLQWGWGEAFQAKVGGADSGHVRIDKTFRAVVCQHSPCQEVVCSSCEVLA